MFDLCTRAYSNYLKYHTRHDYSKKIAKFSIFLMLSFVCFVFSEGMWNGVQVNPPSLLSTTHSCRFENFVKYFFKDRRRDQRTNVTFAVVYVFKNHAMSSEGWLCMGNFCLLSCVVQILTNPLLYLLHRFFEKDIFSLLKKAS